MAQYDTPPTIDPATGRIPPYKQVLAQDATTGNYTIKYEYAKKSQFAKLKPITGLTTPQTSFPTYGATTVATPNVETPGVETANVQTPVVPPNPTQDSGGGGRDRDTFGADPFAPETASLSDLSKIVNPNQVTQTVLGGVVTLAPSALGALIALGNANQQRAAVSELNRRADAGTLGTNPDGTTVTNAEFSSLADSIYGTDEKFGIFGFREQLSPTVNSAIKASKFFGNTNQLTGEPSTSVANQLNNPQSFEQLMREFELDQTTPFQTRPTMRDVTGEITPSRVDTGRRSMRDIAGEVESKTNTNYSGETITSFDGTKTQVGTFSERRAKENEGRNEDGTAEEGSVADMRDIARTQTAPISRSVDRDNAVSNAARSNEVADKNGNAVTNNGKAINHDPSKNKKLAQIKALFSAKRTKKGGGGGGNGGGNGGSGGCFVKGTMIQMLDGTEKEITTIKVGEETKGGIVQAKMEFMPQSIYNYKGVLVSGSHWVVEDNQLIAVEDSKHGILTDRIEPVYTFKTSDNRIWINDIEFGDFETGTDEDWEPYFEKVRQDLNKKLRGEI